MCQVKNVSENVGRLFTYYMQLAIYERVYSVNVNATALSLSETIETKLYMTKW